MVHSKVDSMTIVMRHTVFCRDPDASYTLPRVAVDTPDTLKPAECDAGIRVQAVRDTGTPMGDAVDPLTDGETRSMPNLSSSGYALAPSPTATAVTSGSSLRSRRLPTPRGGS